VIIRAGDKNALLPGAINRGGGFLESSNNYFNRKGSNGNNNEDNNWENPSLVNKFIDRVAPGMKQMGSLGPELDLVDTLVNQLSRGKNSLDWDKNLSELPYAVFDLETTGLKPYKGDEIISVGAVLIDRLKISGRSFHRLANPQRSISNGAVKVTGITPDDVKDKPPVEKVLVQFLDFIGGRVLVAHNASFDLAFLNLKLGKLVQTGMPHPVIDTALLARYLYPDLEDCSLESLCRRWKIELDERHSALGDARITAQIFLALFPRLLESGVNSLGELARLYCLSPVDRSPRYLLRFR